MLRLILIFTLIAAAPALGQPGQNLRRAVALLDYVAGDYPRARRERRAPIWRSASTRCAPGSKRGHLRRK